MKLFYTFIFAVMLAFNATAQVTILPVSENFEGAMPFKVTYSTSQWEVGTLAPFSTGSTPNTKYLKTKEGAGSANTFRNLSVTSGISAKDHKDIKISWSERRTLPSSSQKSNNYPIALYYSVNGFPSTEVIMPLPSPITNWSTQSFTVPNSELVPDSNGEIVIRFSWTVEVPSGSDYYAIDDIRVTGTFINPTNPGVLPVELSSFQAQSLSNSTKLAWSTASEKNNDRFVVERSQDGVNYAPIGQVKGNGNSAVKRDYSFTDAAPANGVNYYRLRQIDFDGKPSLSKVVSLQITKADAGFVASVYPTKAFKDVTISLQNISNDATITVYDASGKIMKTFNTTEREIPLSVSNFKSGLYFVRVADGNTQQVQRFIKE